MRPLVCVFAALAVFVLESPVPAQTAAAPSSDLDTFMAQVLARRDDNWKKLQQYILDEQERAELRGPGRMLVWGDKREYVWYLREGYFVRSPVRANGVAIGEADREKYEQDFLKRARERDQRSRENAKDGAAAPSPPGDVQSLIQQTREPQFVSSAYFLEFKFEAGKYALVGQEKIDGRDVLRIEYYPTRLFSEEPGTRAEARSNQATGRKSKKEEAYGDEIQRLMNKVSLVTLWIEPAQKQIVKYTFDNVQMDFLPVAWLARMEELRATMTMSEPFKGVWLPRDVEIQFSALLAVGPFDVRYHLEYLDYREAITSGRIKKLPADLDLRSRR